MYCNNFSGKYWTIFGLKLSGPPGVPNYRGTTLVRYTAIFDTRSQITANKQWRYFSVSVYSELFVGFVQSSYILIGWSHHLK